MSANILSGKTMSEELRAEIASRVSALKERGLTPGLAVILVGNDPASEIYVRNKGNGCAEVGMYSRTINMPEETTQEQLEAAIEELNKDGVTIVMITHEPEIADHAKRVMYIRDGELHSGAFNSRVKKDEEESE